MPGQPENGFIQQVEKRAAQHAQKTQFIAGTLQRPEQVQQIEHFLLGVKGMSAHKIVIDAVAAQASS